MSQPPSWSDDDPQQVPRWDDSPSGPGVPEPVYGQPPPAAGPGGGPPREALAGFWIRFAGALIDGILLGVVGGLLDRLIPGGDTEILGGYTFVSLLLGALYFGYLHSAKAGQTIGQLVCGIRVVNARDGGQVSAQNALVRWVVSYLSGLVLALGYLWMLWDPYRQTWHDKAASTYVVKTRFYPAPASIGQR